MAIESDDDSDFEDELTNSESPNGPPTLISRGGHNLGRDPHEDIDFERRVFDWQVTLELQAREARDRSEIIDRLVQIYGGQIMYGLRFVIESDINHALSNDERRELAEAELRDRRRERELAARIRLGTLTVQQISTERAAIQWSQSQRSTTYKQELDRIVRIFDGAIRHVVDGWTGWRARARGTASTPQQAPGGRRSQ